MIVTDPESPASKVAVTNTTEGCAWKTPQHQGADGHFSARGFVGYGIWPITIEDKITRTLYKMFIISCEMPQGEVSGEAFLFVFVCSHVV